jgi:pimeloyl-ACP methyl ester carboxylesterase
MFGLLHAPAEGARGAVVLCPPVGHEYMNSYSTFRELANRLEELGFAALRFDYRSTGDSFDRTPTDANVAGFVEDVQVAMEFVQTLGLDYLAVAGMRLGATFASTRCSLKPVDSLVLWDPCSSGRSFLREQHLLGLVAGRGRDQEPGTLAIPGFSGSPEMLDEIKGLSLRSQAGPLADRVLLLTRPGHEADAELLEGIDLEHREATGQRELLDVESPRLTVPTAALSLVATWLDSVAPQAKQPLKVPESQPVQVAIGSATAATPDDPDAPGSSVLVCEQEIILGPSGLFGVATEPAGGGSGPVCLFASVANEHRVGPGRLWVGLSRHLAAAGFKCVRFEFNGYGESPPRDPVIGPQVFALSNIDDVIDGVRVCSADDPRNVVLFGLCSSAYQILEAAMTLAPRGVCALNPIFLFRPPELETSGKIDERRRFCIPQTRLLTMARKRASLRGLRLRIPSLDWKIRGPLRALNWRIRNILQPSKDVPGGGLKTLVESGVDVLLICGPEDVQALQHLPRSSAGSAAAGGIHMEFIPDLNHTLFSAADREAVTALILDHVVNRFGQSPMNSPTS